MRIVIIITSILSVMLLGQVTLSAQEAPNQPAAPVVNAEGPQWVWGEVVSVDPAAKVIKVKYLDYETDTEKEMDLKVNEATTFEGVGSLEEIKLQDMVSIDWALGPGGVSLAQTISRESIEEAPAADNMAAPAYEMDNPAAAPVPVEKQP
ncbi:MAG: hypothetical protein MUF05_05475 [Candidatus Omnitrophica bacterium]|jgi:23S rRNA C2498 (ribose-2'-O)-methylase RlmM|nr:hypothetical protein [Candidatus Omnitrophota bacterium]